MTQQDLCRLRRDYESCALAPDKCTEPEALSLAWAEAAGCLLLRRRMGEAICFDYPIPGPEGEEDRALEAVETWCAEQEVPLALSVPAEKAPRLLARYPRVRVSHQRDAASHYLFHVENELYALAELPTIHTARLTLSALTDSDRAAYNRLCLDDARNRYWGYDYREDWHGEPLEDYFLDVARQDFARHMTLNLAVRLEGKCIGEVVLYRFTGRGSAELGCRIAPEYSGHGYGAEAFGAMADWGLSSLHLSAVTARSYRENAASLRMLAAHMRPDGEDGTFRYFRKEA